MGASDGGSSKDSNYRSTLHDKLFRNLTLVFATGTILSSAYAGFTVRDTIIKKQSPRYIELRQAYQTMDHLEDKLGELRAVPIRDKQIIIDNLTTEYKSALQTYNKLNNHGIVDEYFDLRVKGTRNFALYGLLGFIFGVSAAGSFANYLSDHGERKFRERIRLYKEDSIASHV